MTNLQMVKEFIKGSNEEELRDIMNVASIRKSELAFDKKDSFTIGDTVAIIHKKISPKRVFRIIKINSKNIKVSDNKDTYTVSPTLLKAV